MSADHSMPTPERLQELAAAEAARWAAISSDYQRDAVYLAEELARENVEGVLNIEVPRLLAEELPGFAARALEGAGWEVDEQPTFVFDVPDDGNVPGLGLAEAASAWHEGATGFIHLHPRLLDPWTVVHELAHWVDSRDRHGPRFCANYVGLVRAALGDHAAEELLALFAEHGVELDGERIK